MCRLWGGFSFSMCSPTHRCIYPPIASRPLDPSLFATHHFPLGDTMAAYDVFADAANSGALKVVLQGAGESPSAPATTEQSVAVA